MQYTYTPQGVCSKQMIIEIDEDNQTIKSVKIVGGCPGNTVGVSKLVEGKIKRNSMWIQRYILSRSISNCFRSNKKRTM